MVTGGVLAQTNAPHEPNDDRSGATPIDGGQINGTLSSGNDTDWYSFQATKGELVTLLFTKPVNNDTGLYVRIYAPDSDDDFSWILSDGYDKRSQDSFFAPRSGTYYIRVETSYGGAEGPVPYSVRLLDVPFRQNASRTPSGVPQETEPNDDDPTATRFNGTRITGEISTRGDADWYAINATEGENVSIRLTKPADKSVLAMYLYAPNGTEVANDTAFEGVETATVAVVANQTGTYELYVASDLSGINISYTLYSPAKAAPTLTTTSTETSADGTATENEPNDNRENATPIDGARINGTLRSGNKTDWYSFQATKGETVTVLLTKPDTGNGTFFGLYFDVYAPDSGRSLGSDILYANDTRGQVTFIAERSGTHYIRIDNTYNGADEPIQYVVRLPDHPAQLTASKTSSGIPQETEPNDDPTAATLVQGTRITGEIGVQGDRDHYAINATAGENVSILLEKPAAKPNLTFVLYAPNGTEIVKDTIPKGVSRGHVAVTASQSGRYVIEVVAVKASSTNIPYTLYTPARAAPASTPTPVPETPTPGDTSRASGEAAADRNSSDNESSGSSTSGPGFGPVVAVVALLTGGLFAARQLSD